MNDPEASTLGIIFTIILVLILSSFGFLNMGAHYGAKEAKNQTTIECIEKPELCKQRYKYLKLREKLGEY
jgi:hypothetical protein